MIGQFFERQFAGEVLREQAHGLRVLEMAQYVHLPFVVACSFIELAAQQRVQLRPVGRARTSVRVSSSSSSRIGWRAR